ncbi:MAG: hypothetical protein V1804_03340 [Patescibacteria group bacterium]
MSEKFINHPAYNDGLEEYPHPETARETEEAKKLAFVTDKEGAKKRIREFGISEEDKTLVNNLENNERKESFSPKEIAYGYLLLEDPNLLNRKDLIESKQYSAHLAMYLAELKEFSGRKNFIADILETLGIKKGENKEYDIKEVKKAMAERGFEFKYVNPGTEDLQAFVEVKTRGRSIEDRRKCTGTIIPRIYYKGEELINGVAGRAAH